MPTLEDVAEMAGVSVSTVSNVVNHKGRVSAATIQRVEQAVNEVGYRPNPIARALRRSTTESFGFVANIGNPYFVDVMRGVEAAVRTAGHTLLVGNSDDDALLESAALRALAERRVDGLVVSLTPEASDEVLPFLASLKMPVVLIDRPADADMDQVLVENIRSTMALVGHLLDLGHRRVGMIAGLAGISTSEERVEGWRRAHEERSLQIDTALLVNGGSRRQGAIEATQLLLGLDQPPTAIVAGNNSMTFGALQALRSSAKRVPEDVALVGFDDIEWAADVVPSLTVVAQPSYEIGRTAVEMLLRRVSDPGRAREITRLDPTLVHRRSCGCPAN